MPRAAAVLSALLIAAIPIASAAEAACGTRAGFSLNDHGTAREARRFNGALVLTSGLRVNTDGASNSYHPIGTSRGALNSICNGIGINTRPVRMRTSGSPPSGRRQ